MTKRFAEELKAQYRCSSCSDPHAPAKKFCTYHLAAARAAWSRHTAKCKAEGRCINCVEPKPKKGQRCTTCQERNQKRCRAWGAVHRERLRQRRRDRIAAGMCGACGKGPGVAGHERCTTCYPKGYRS